MHNSCELPQPKTSVLIMIRYAFYHTPCGIIKVGHEDNFILSIRRCDQIDAPHDPAPVSDLTNQQLQEYFEGNRHTFDLPLKPVGTAFQLSVWDMLCRIPYGQVRTYGQIATMLGNPKCSRAVGMACNRNPLWIAIPCHRVVGANGLTGYAGGLAMKHALLELEQHQ